MRRATKVSTSRVDMQPEVSRLDDQPVSPDSPSGRARSLASIPSAPERPYFHGSERGGADDYPIYVLDVDAIISEIHGDGEALPIPANLSEH